MIKTRVYTFKEEKMAIFKTVWKETSGWRPCKQATKEAILRRKIPTKAMIAWTLNKLYFIVYWKIKS